MVSVTSVTTAAFLPATAGAVIAALALTKYSSFLEDANAPLLTNIVASKIATKVLLELNKREVTARTLFNIFLKKDEMPFAAASLDASFALLEEAAITDVLSKSSAEIDSVATIRAGGARVFCCSLKTLLCKIVPFTPTALAASGFPNSKFIPVNAAASREALKYFPVLVVAALLVFSFALLPLFAALLVLPPFTSEYIPEPNVTNAAAPVTMANPA